MKVGVLTFHRCINYGSYWQTRCLVHGLRDLGYEPFVLDHRSNYVDLAEWRCALSPDAKRRSGKLDRKALVCKTRRLLNDVVTLPLTDPVNLDNPEQWPELDAMIIGSDEVWNLRHPWYSGRPAFFGNGIQTRKLISFAGSFGNFSCWEGIGEPWTTFLKDFRYLSVRDENSWWMLKNCLGLEAEITLDPCLVWPPEITGEDSVQQYAVVYGHGFSREFSKAVTDWAHENRLRLISLGYRNDWAHEQRLDASPSEFARAMAGAKAVATNFFHGCVFALANGKPFACETTPYRDIKVRGLMELLGAEQHLRGEPQELLCQPLCEEIGVRTKVLRESSISYLKRALDA